MQLARRSRHRRSNSERQTARRRRTGSWVDLAGCSFVYEHRDERLQRMLGANRRAGICRRRSTKLLALRLGRRFRDRLIRPFSLQHLYLRLALGRTSCRASSWPSTAISNRGSLSTGSSTSAATRSSPSRSISAKRSTWSRSANWPSISAPTAAQVHRSPRVCSCASSPCRSCKPMPSIKTNCFLGSALARYVIAQELVRAAPRGRLRYRRPLPPPARGTTRSAWRPPSPPRIPSSKVMAPVREWNLKNLDDKLKYARKRHIPIEEPVNERGDRRSQSLGRQPLCQRS